VCSPYVSPRVHLEAVRLEEVRGVVAVPGGAGAGGVVAGAGCGVNRAGSGVDLAGCGVSRAGSGVDGAGGGLVAWTRGAVLPRLGVLSLSGVGHLSDEARVAVDVVGDGLTPAVGQVHGVRPLRVVVIPLLLVVEFGVVFVDGPVELVLGGFVGLFGPRSVVARRRGRLVGRG